MTRTFDSGLESAKRTWVRKRVTELLAPLLKGNSYMRGFDPVKGFVLALEKLAGTLASYDRGESLDQLFAALQGRTPAILIALGDRVLSPAGIGGARAMSFLDVHLYFVNQHQRGLLARVEPDNVAAADDEADQGIDTMMECAEELLTAERLDEVTDGAVIKHMQLKREADLFTGRQYSIWEQMWLVGVTSTINKKRAITQRIVGMHTVVHPPTEPSDSPAAVTFDTDLEVSS